MGVNCLCFRTGLMNLPLPLRTLLHIREKKDHCSQQHTIRSELSVCSNSHASSPAGSIRRLPGGIFPGHQFISPITSMSDGTSTARTRKVSTRLTPTNRNPNWFRTLIELSISAAKATVIITPAVVMVVPVSAKPFRIA